jgi:hypothetical protein
MALHGRLQEYVFLFHYLLHLPLSVFSLFRLCVVPRYVRALCSVVSLMRDPALWLRSRFTFGATDLAKLKWQLHCHPSM